MPLIRLWKANPNGSPKLPMSMPSPIHYCPIWDIDPSKFVERQKFISVGLSKYMDFWKVGIAQNVTYEMKMKPYVEYWEDILLHLSRPLPCQSAILLEGLWLSNNWKSNYSEALLSTIIDGANLEDPIQHPYHGPKNMKPSIMYTLFKNLNAGDFVFVKPHDPGLILVWMGRT